MGDEAETEGDITDVKVRLYVLYGHYEETKPI
jgi:hypothetical protein